MASWKRLYADLSGPEGGASGYVRIVAPTDQKAQAVYDVLGGYILASPGTVDINGSTRFQYLIPSENGPVFAGSAGLRFDAADVSANPGKTLTGTSFLAPASAFGAGVVPTPAQIRSAATQVVRGQGALGSPSGRTDAGDLDLWMLPGAPSAYPPNTKYWYMIAPTAVTSGSTPSIANDVPVGDVNVLGRAVSLWSNRTPLAPAILTPAAQATVFAGSEIDFRYNPMDPDRVGTFPNDVGPNDFRDVAGVQIQYAPQPTQSNPTPTWVDLPIANTAGTAVGPGWYMDQTITAAANSGAKVFWQTGVLKLRCGFSTLSPSTASIPSGDWQIRVRTFDYGHPFPDSSASLGKSDVPPLGDMTRGYTPDNYPAVNTSPWSAPINLSISQQVPAPLPINPAGNRGVVAGSPVTLTWQYRNTYSPPFTQARRTIQIRQVGDVWTTLVDDQASASASYTVAGFSLVSGNQYEWRVRVTDSSLVVSPYSESAFFWMVPELASGDVIPLPSETIDGATLGCGTHRVEVYRRGGSERLGTITDVSYLDWGRVRDDISTAKIVVSGWGIDCGNLLAKLQTWAYEIVLFRDNGFGVERVWEGPITLLTYERDSVTIHAKDVMAYSYRRIIRQALSDTKNGATVTDRAARILHNAFAPDDPNVLSYLHVLAQPDDAKQYRSTPAYSRTAFEEIDDMAANAGLDYTAVGRAILLWSTKHRIGTLPEFQDRDLGSSPIVSEYGMSMANVYAVSDGNGVYGEATRLNEDGEDPSYGTVEMLSSTWASDSAAEAGTYTQEGLNTLRASFAAAAERSIGDRYPPPVVVRVPDNTRLNPDTVLSIQHLVPGVVVPLRSTGTLRTVVATQKLDAIKVVEQKGEESITITLSPFSRDDTALGEGEV